MDFWDKEEDEKLIDLINTYGTKWSEISYHFPDRTHSSIRNRWIRINQHPTKNFGKKKIKKYNKCSKCGLIKKGHICGRQNSLPDSLISIKKNKNLSELPNTLFKNLDHNLDLSSSLHISEKKVNSIFNEYYNIQNLDTNQEELFTSSFKTIKEDNINLKNFSELLTRHINFYEKLPPLGICTDLNSLGVNIDFSKENILGIDNNQIINATPRVEINNTSFKFKNDKKKIKIIGEEYLSKVYKDNHYPSPKVKASLIQLTGLDRKQVENWFHNKRRREKKKLSKYQ